MGLSVVTANWIVPFLVRDGFDLASAGLLGSFTAAGSILTRPLGGWLHGKHPSRSRWLLIASLGLGGISSLGIALVTGPILIATATVALGLAAGLPFAIVFTGAARTRPEAPGSAIALVNMFGNLTTVVGTPLLGLAFSAPSGARWGFIALAGLWGVSLLLLLLFGSVVDYGPHLTREGLHE
jgi:MFS family permease